MNTQKHILFGIFLLFSACVSHASNSVVTDQEKYSFQSMINQSPDDSTAINLETQKDWEVTFAANFDLAHRKTNFYRSNHNTFLSQGDSRVELWLPPGRKSLSWGPYVRFAGLVSNRSYAWENAFLAKPGVGFQIYPFSTQACKESDNPFIRHLGPLRLFGEYNRLDYWGTDNTWRPDDQTRIGLEYWRAVNVNQPDQDFWWEFWSGIYRQSANEFDPSYDSWICANSLRAGSRLADDDLLNCFSPYLVLESSLTENSSYYWENRLLWGGGIRFDPPLKFLPREMDIGRLVFFIEYLDVASYYKTSSGSVPNYDLRAGINLSIGRWWQYE